MLLGEYLSVSFRLCRRARKTRLFHRLSRTSPLFYGSYYNRGLKSGSCGWWANKSWRRTLRQKSLICRSNWASVGGLSEGLNLRPMPRTLDWRSVSFTWERLWISKFRGRRSYRGRVASLKSRFSSGERLSILRGRNLCPGRFLPTSEDG